MKLFADEYINTGRQIELDWARGLAVLFMVFKHVKSYLPGFPLSSPYSQIISFFFFLLAAPAFMILLGAGVVFSRNRSPKKMALRGLSLLALNYALHFTAFGIPHLIMFANTNDTAHLEGFVIEVFCVDILAFAGLSFLFFALMEKLRLRCVDVVLITLVLSCLNFVIIPIDNFYLGVLLGHFVYVGENEFFSFLPWIGYPVMGYVFGGLLKRCTDKNFFYKYLFAFSALIVTAISLASLKYGFFDIWAIYFGPLKYFYQDFIQYIIVGGICFSWLSALFILSGIRISFLDFAGKQLSRWSKNVTIIFVAHWVIIGWLSVFNWIEFPQIPYVNFITGIVIVILSDAAAVLFLKAAAFARR
jgi:uncharacterized membrane protein